MASITPVTVGSGYGANKRFSGAQLRDAVLLTNCYDQMKVFSIRETTLYDVGLAAPGAAPTGSETGAGNVNGDVRYRVRWREANSGYGVTSLASAELSVTTSSKQIRITAPGSPPARATHWILERTNDGGSVFYPVNRTAAAPDGTAVGTTTFDDNVADDTLNQRTPFHDRQGQPTRRYRFLLTHMNRIFASGRTNHAGSFGFTNGSTTVTDSGSTFRTGHVGMDLMVTDDTDGKSYRIAAYVNDGQITLATAYTGTTGTKAAVIAGEGNIVGWCELGEPEHWGSAEYGFLSNEKRLGDAGEPIMAGCGIGPQGIVWAKERELWYHYYSADPATAPVGDGRFIKIPVARGAAGPLALKFDGNFVYGMDALGIWRMAPGGEPHNISDPLGYDFIRNFLDACNGENWWIGCDPLLRWLYFGVTQRTQTGTYPKLAYLWDQRREKWIGSKTWHHGITTVFELFDKQHAPRLAFFSDITDNGPSCCWADNIGKSLGAGASAPPLSGTVTSVTSVTLTCTGAAWPTTGEQLKGVPVFKTNSAGAAGETRIIKSNTADTLTTDAWTATPVDGDLFYIGAMDASYRTPRFDCGYPHRKKLFRTAWVKLKYKTACVPLKVRAYFDGDSAAMANNAALAEDGVTVAANLAPVTLDPTIAEYRFEVPLHNRLADDVQFEFYSQKAGEPWDIVAEIRLVFDVDEATRPRKAWN